MPVFGQASSRTCYLKDSVALLTNPSPCGENYYRQTFLDQRTSLALQMLNPPVGAQKRRSRGQFFGQFKFEAVVTSARMVVSLCCAVGETISYDAPYSVMPSASELHLARPVDVA